MAATSQGCETFFSVKIHGALSAKCKTI
uniref:Uncharacterized protein n=1 Tax=Arundo donax TaxID=35708 RepID=A0A0A9BVG6_ARUDO